MAPLLGNLLALGLNLAPMRGVLAVLDSNEIGEMNPMFSVSLAPMALTSLVYGMVLRDWWLAAPNLSSLPLGLFYSLILLRALPPKRFLPYAAFLAALIFCSAFLGVFNLIYLGQGTSSAALSQGIGATVMICLMYIAPLSTMWKVIKDKDSSSIYIPVSLVIFINSCFWFGYGLFIQQPFIWAPNVLGALSAIAQIILALIYPRTKAGGKSFLTIRGKRLWPGSASSETPVESLDAPTDTIELAADAFAKSDKLDGI